MTDSLPVDPVANKPTSQRRDADPLVGQPLVDAPGGELAHPSAQPESLPHVGSTDEDQIPDWLKEMSESSAGETIDASAPNPSAEPVALEEAPASETDLANAEPPAREELPNWLKEVAAPQERPTETAAPESEARPQPTSSPEEVPQWLSQPYQMPAADERGVPSEAKEEGVVFPDTVTLEQPVQETPHVDEGTPPSNVRETAQATEGLDLQAPDLKTSEPIAERSQEAQTANRGGTGLGKEGLIEPTEFGPAAGEERPKELIETGEMPDWMHELAPPGTPSLPEKGKGLRDERPHLADDVRVELPDWLREVALERGGAEPTLGGPATETLTPTPPSEMPSWVEELRTHAASAVTAEPPSELAEAEGPLAGVHGILPIAFSVAQPHTPSAAGPSQNDGGRLFESVLTAAAERSFTPMPSLARPARGSWANRWIYLAVFLAALVPLFIPSDSAGLGLTVNNTTPTALFYDKIHSLAPGSTVLLAFDYDAGQAVELNPAARVIVQDLARRHVNVMALSTSPAGAQIAETILLEATRQDPGWRRGDNFVNVGYIPGEEAGLRALADRWLPQNQLDFEDQTLASLPLAHKLGGLQDFALAVEFAGGDASLRWWMEQVQPHQPVPFVAAVSAAAEPQARNYLAANQLAAFLRGLGGAAEYELFANQTGLTVRTVDALSFSQILIAGIIVLGNAVFLFGRLRTSTPMRS